MRADAHREEEDEEEDEDEDDEEERMLPDPGRNDENDRPFETPEDTHI